MPPNRQLLSLLAVAALVAVVPAAQASFGGPNGRIVFAQSYFMPFGERGDSPVGDLCSAASDGSGHTKLIEGDASGFASWPSFSPGGDRLMYVRGTGGGGVPVIARADGTGRRLLPGGGVWWPAWSADGGRIYATEYALGSTELVAIATVDGARARLTATPDREEVYPAASPDGTQLAYIESSLDTTKRRLVVADIDARSPRVVAALGAIGPPDWSPDAKRLVFAADSGIWEAAADGSSLRALRPSGREPAYSPDGSRIAFSDEGDIWTMAADGSDATRVIATAATESHPTWQPGQAAVRALGKGRCVISGTAGDDVIDGTPGPDVILDLGGNDTIRGLGGADTILDGPGDDVILAGPGNDRVEWRHGQNRIDGGSGADWLGHPLSAGGEPQILIGGPGDDHLVGTWQADLLAGGSGNDVLLGGLGSDVLRGGSGDDTMGGSRGDDTLDGGPGRDRLDGGKGSDLLLAADRAADVVVGGPGRDRARLDVVDRRTGVERVLGR